MQSTVKHDFRLATNVLLDQGIPLIEWGDQVLESHGFPAVTSVYSYIVPDAQICNASTSLQEAGILAVEPNLAMKCLGIFGTAGYLHVSANDSQQWPFMLQLLPESLVHLSLPDTEPVPSRFDHTHTVHRPKLPEHCISLVKCLEDYPPLSREKMLPQRYLVTLIAVGVFKEKEFGKLWVPEEELESESDYQARCVAAVAEVRSWEMADKDLLYQSKLVDILFSDYMKKSSGENVS